MNRELITDVEIEGVHGWDAPDFCDAFISFACYDGVPMTDEQLVEINQDSDFVREKLEAQLY